MNNLLYIINCFLNHVVSSPLSIDICDKHYHAGLVYGEGAILTLIFTLKCFYFWLPDENFQCLLSLNYIDLVWCVCITGVITSHQTMRINPNAQKWNLLFHLLLRIYFILWCGYTLSELLGQLLHLYWFRNEKEKPCKHF